MNGVFVVGVAESVMVRGKLGWVKAEIGEDGCETGLVEEWL